MEALLDELRPILAQTLAALLISLLTAVLGFIAWAVKSLRDYFVAKNMTLYRAMLDQVIARAKASLPADLVLNATQATADTIAAHLTDYAKRTSPGILAKLGVDNAKLAERMATEAVIWLKTERAKANVTNPNL